VIEETGTVTAVSGGMAEVECERRSTCGSCSVHGACGTSLLERFFGRKQHVLAAANPVGAEPGDRVVVGIREGVMLQAAFTAYLVPLLAMMLAALGSEWLAERLMPAWSEGLSALAGLAGLACGLWWLSLYSARRNTDERFQAVVLRRSIPPPVRVATDGLSPEQWSGAVESRTPVEHS
jgi:sigma-E factor negative regulatory protein RseC